MNNATLKDIAHANASGAIDQVGPEIRGGYDTLSESVVAHAVNVVDTVREGGGTDADVSRAMREYVSELRRSADIDQLLFEIATENAIALI